MEAHHSQSACFGVVGRPITTGKHNGMLLVATVES